MAERRMMMHGNGEGPDRRSGPSFSAYLHKPLPWAVQLLPLGPVFLQWSPVHSLLLLPWVQINGPSHFGLLLFANAAVGPNASNDSDMAVIREHMLRMAFTPTKKFTPTAEICRDAPGMLGSIPRRAQTEKNNS
jgi:hypothetical protein